jgi:hypothetical protein
MDSPSPDAVFQLSVLSRLPATLSHALHSSATKLLDDGSRLAAQQRDIALTVDARQIHPDSQLARPNLAQRIIWIATNCDQWSIPRGELFDQLAERPFLPRRRRLQVNERKLNPMSHRLPSRIFGGSTHNGRPMFLLCCANPQM